MADLIVANLENRLLAQFKVAQMKAAENERLKDEIKQLDDKVMRLLLLLKAGGDKVTELKARVKELEDALRALTMASEPPSDEVWTKAEQVLGEKANEHP